MSKFDDFLRARAGFQSVLKVELAFMDLCDGDAAAAMLLSHILDVVRVGFWRQRDPKTGRLYWPFPHSALWTALRMPRKRRITAMARLKSLGLVVTKVAVLDDRTCLLVSPCGEEILRQWGKVLAGEVPVEMEPGDG